MKMTFEREEISDHWLTFRKIWRDNWWWSGEPCEVRRCLLWRGLRFHCPMYNAFVSCIFFSKCFYFSYYIARYFLSSLYIYTQYSDWPHYSLTIHMSSKLPYTSVCPRPEHQPAAYLGVVQLWLLILSINGCCHYVQSLLFFQSIYLLSVFLTKNYEDKMIHVLSLST